MTKHNELRISFAEWLYRMSECDVPYQARALAVYAVAFKAASNEELACLTGMDTKGVADKTYNKWKRYLSNEGWVIVRQVTIGRQTTIEVDPAFKEAPVTFTDLVRRSPRKFYGSSLVPITDPVLVEITDEDGKNYGSKEQITSTSAVKVTGDAAQDAPAYANGHARDTTPPATKESPSEISSYEEASQLARDTPVVREGLAGLNGSADPMISDILAWMGSGTEFNARQWLSTFVQQFGQEVVRNSYMKLKTDLLSGSLIAKPLATWSRIAQRMKAEPPERGSRDDTPKETRRDRMRRYIEEAQSKLQKGHARHEP